MAGVLEVAMFLKWRCAAYRPVTIAAYLITYTALGLTSARKVLIDHAVTVVIFAIAKSLSEWLHLIFILFVDATFPCAIPAYRSCVGADTQLIAALGPLFFTWNVVGVALDFNRWVKFNRLNGRAK